MWDLAGDRRLDQPLRGRPGDGLRRHSPKGLALSPDGARSRSRSRTGRVDLIDARTLEGRRVARALEAPRSPSASLRTGACWRSPARARACALGRAHACPAGRAGRALGTSFSQEVAFSPDGRRWRPAGSTTTGVRPRCRSGTCARAIRRRPLRRGVAVALPSAPDGRLLAAAVHRGAHEVRAVRRRSPRQAARHRRLRPLGRLQPRRRACSRSVITAAASSCSRPSTWKQVGRRLEGHRARVTALEFSRDGRRLRHRRRGRNGALWDADTP